MKGHLPAGRYDVRWQLLRKETAMGMHQNVTQIGLDVHRKFSIASLRDASGKVVARERLEHADRNELRKQIHRWPAHTPVILEATFGWGWLSDELLGMKMDPHLASSRKVAGWRTARSLAKSNRIDADLLGELWSEKPVIRHGLPYRWWEVWLAPQEVRDDRELLRHRMTLVREQTGVKNRIHALLHRHGIVVELSDLFGVAGRRLLSKLICDGKDPVEELASKGVPALRQTARRTLKDLLMLLDQLRRSIARATRQFRWSLERSAAGQRLMTIPGISTVLAYTIVAEIGRIERFGKSRCLLRYSLLAPEADDSGEEREGKPIGRRIGHAGRKTLQWAWIEAAHGAARKDKLFRAIFDRRTDNGKQDRGRGYITVANHLCRVGYAMWKNETNYQEVSPARPGSVKKRVELISSGNGPALTPYGHRPELSKA
jgi:transposase